MKAIDHLTLVRSVASSTDEEFIEAINAEIAKLNEEGKSVGLATLQLEKATAVLAVFAVSG